MSYSIHDHYDCYDAWDEPSIEFADEGSALRAASPSNPRNLPCPTCRRENMLTPADHARGYQCNYCADADEGIG